MHFKGDLLQHTMSQDYVVKFMLLSCVSQFPSDTSYFLKIVIKGVTFIDNDSVDPLQCVEIMQ